MRLLLLKAHPASQTLPSLVSVKPYTRADGAEVAGHVAIRHRRIEEAAPAAAPATPLDDFVDRHGGPSGLRNQLGAMTDEQRATLVEAMAAMGGVAVGDVATKLGLQPGDFARSPTELDMVIGTDDGDLPPQVFDGEVAPRSAFDAEVEEIEDREDLAAEMAKSPHSDEAKGMLHRMAVKLITRLLCIR
jgi:hypothetical protein